MPLQAPPTPPAQNYASTPHSPCRKLCHCPPPPPPHCYAIIVSPITGPYGLEVCSTEYKITVIILALRQIGLSEQCRPRSDFCYLNCIFLIHD